MWIVVMALQLFVPVAGVVGGVLGWMALDANPPNTARLKTAGWWLALPWISYAVLGGPFAQGTSGFVFPPLVAVVLALRWWARSRGASSAPQVEPVSAIAIDDAPTEPAPAAAARSRGDISDLRLVSFKHLAIALAVTVPALWLISMPGRGRSGPGHGIGADFALQLLATWATLLAAVAAPVLAIIHVFRPAPALVAAYSVLALCVILGHASLLVLGSWEWLLDGEEELALALVVASIATLVPAYVAKASRASG